MEKDCERRDSEVSFLPDMLIESEQIQRPWQPVVVTVTAGDTSSFVRHQSTNPLIH
jgi:hypothetical protein